MKVYTGTLPKDTKRVLTLIKDLSDLQRFYLTGGTALSLQLGHRESEDLDFFIQESFDPRRLQEHLMQCVTLDDVRIEEGTLNIFIDKVKLQFLQYPYPLLEHLDLWNGIYLSSVMDIACTKLMTISMRGSKKDFIDLYVILQNMSLKDLFEKLKKKYKQVGYNYPHIIKSLIYFEDADAQPMPRMHISVSWEEVKEFIIDRVKKSTF